MSINISDYNRNGIFIKEINGGVIDRPAPQQAVVHFVPGFSRKGTVFNRPVLINTAKERNAYFGDIDRFLEKKGSFFHRTIDIALQTAPVYAMNILKTNSTDQLNYKSISLSAMHDNSPTQTEQYDNFFNKAGFWQRDTESFLNFAQNNENMIHFTNVSDKKLTVFMFKTTRPGFDITAEKWYPADRIPSYVNKNSLMSDFLVRVIIVAGEWNNYTQLAADTNWSKYFAPSGLRKTEVNKFIKDTGVSVLGDYTGSVLPYFNDGKNNIFIESLINLDTDRTGLFCAVDIDNIEADFLTNKIDLIGETLVGIDKPTIDFMSYQDTIIEQDTFDKIEIDRPLNVISNNLPNSLGYFEADGASVLTTTDITFEGYTAYTNNGTITVSTQSVFNFPLQANDTWIAYTYFIDSNGVLQEGAGLVSATQVLAEGANIYSGYSNDAIVLGYVLYHTDSLGAVTTTWESVAFDGTNYVDIVVGTNPSDDVTATVTANSAYYVFNNTATATKKDYKEWRTLQFFRNLVTRKTITSLIAGATANTYFKVSDLTWFDNSTGTTGDKEILLTNSTATPFTFDDSNLTMFINNIAFGNGINGLRPGYSVNVLNYGYLSEGSELYLDFIDGRINSGDYFYEVVANGLTRFVRYTDLNNPTAIGNYLVVEGSIASTLGISAGDTLSDKYVIDGITYSFESAEDSAGLDYGQYLGLSVGEIAIRITELVITTTNVNTDICDFEPTYLKMYSVGGGVYVDYMADKEFTAIKPIVDLALNNTIKIYSGESNYTQTLEIEIVSDNKFTMNLDRYPEVKVGDFVKAYYDQLLLQPGEQPKKFARIIKKAIVNGKAEITTDIKYDAVEISTGVFQTTRYTTIENYIDTYKAITLNGFMPNSLSIPDGTEVRQNEILNVIGKDTALYNAIINKEKFNFRYLIDSFGLGLTEFSKQQLADITGKRKNCLAFLNMPSAKMFKNSNAPVFTNDDNTLNLELVKQGGDLEKNPPFLYSFAQGSGDDDGRDTSAYFFPYVIINDENKPLLFPPAAYVANTYMRKIGSSIAGIYNHTVAAGVDNGLIKGIGNTEMDFTEFDLEQLDAMGANPIMYNKTYGFYIFSEYTASIEKLSPLSFIHTREILIDLENDLYAMLFKYQFKFNTAAVRAKIKREADDICQRYVDRQALYAYENIINEFNNTPELINNQFGLLETYIEVVAAMGKIVNVINVLGNGQLAGATGFMAQ